MSHTWEGSDRDNAMDKKTGYKEGSREDEALDTHMQKVMAKEEMKKRAIKTARMKLMGK